MIPSKEFLFETAASWNLFPGRKFPAGNEEPAAGRIIIPGILIGFLSALAAWSGGFLFGQTAAGIAAAILFTLIYELLADWNGIRNTTAFLSLRLSNGPLAEKNGAEPRFTLTSFFILLSLYSLRALAIGLTAAFAPSLFIPVFTASFLLRFELVSFSDEMHDPLLEADPAERTFTYRIAILTFLLAPLLSFHLINFARVFLIAAAALLIRAVQRRMLARVQTTRIPLRRISVYSFTAELLLFYAAAAVL